MKYIKDCKVGDVLYCVLYPSFYDDYIGDIFQVTIKDIKYGSEFDGGDTYKCSRYDAAGIEREYIFQNQTSDRHDSLILDTDYAYYGNEGMFYTTYQAAVDFLINKLQRYVLKSLRNLEDAESKFGLAKYNCFQKRTNKVKQDYKSYKKYEIYDINSYSDKSPNWVDKQLKGKKVKVYKKLIETNCYGSVKWSGSDIFVQEFDSIEEANRFMKENDKSYYHGKSDRWFEGDRYFIKDDDE
jgi:hypothetical protein